MKSLIPGLLIFVAGSVYAQTPDSVIILSEKDFRPVTTFNTNQPLYLLNGKKFSADSLNLLNPTKIESIYVVKGLEAKEKYGDEGKNGVVLIKLKDAARKED